MKFIVERDALLKALAPAFRLARVKAAIPVFNHVLLTAERDLLRIAGNDTMACAECSCPAEVEATGCVAVPGESLHKLAQRAPEGCQLVAELDSVGELVLRFGRSRYKLPTLPAEQFPAMMAVEDATEFELTAEQVAIIFARTRPFTEPVTGRINLSGVHLCERKGQLVGEAADGIRLMRRSVKVKVKGLVSVIVPGVAVDAIVELAKEGGRFRCAAKLISVEANSARLTTRLVDAEYPDLQRAISDVSAHGFIECDREELIAAVDRLTILDDDKRAIRIAFEEDGEAIMVSLRGRGEGSETVAAVIDNLKAGEFGVAPAMLRSLLDETPGELVRLHFIDPGSAIRIAHKLTPDLVAVVMPRRI